jgi:L-fuconolactonase
VIEHLGSLGRAGGEGSGPQVVQRVLALARFPNAYIKIPGLGEFCRRAMPVREPFPFEEPIPPLLGQVYDAFGPDRMMWGSDFPPVSGREGYRNALRWMMEQFAERSEADRERIFGGTALRVFPVRG